MRFNFHDLDQFWFKRCLIFIGLILTGTACVHGDDRPNILFIFSDDHAPNAIGAYDGWLKEVNPTPNIDASLDKACCFKTVFVQTPFAVPVELSSSRASTAI